MNKMKCERWRIESFVLPRRILENPDLANALRDLVEQADDLHWKLRKILTAMIAEALPVSGEQTRSKSNRDKRTIEEKIYDNSSAVNAFYSHIEKTFLKIVASIGAVDIEVIDREWQEALIKAGWKSWAAISSQLGSSQQTWKAIARATPRISGLLKSIEATMPELYSVEIHA